MAKKPQGKMQGILKGCQKYCDDNDKSTGFMIQYMVDHLLLHYKHLDYYSAHDIVMDYLREDSE